MNTQINSMLVQIRNRLNESAWGPEISAPNSDGFDAGEAGELGAKNYNDISDALDKYIMGMVDNLMVQYECTDDEAVDMVFNAIDSLASENKIPEMPEENASDDEVAIWIGKAVTSGLQRMVDDYARAEQ